MVVRESRPEAVVSASRSASLAARSLGIPSFFISDYEHVSLSAFRAARSYVFHPGVISATAYTSKGIPADRLIAFRGIKEDITFADVDVPAAPDALAEEFDVPTGIPRILVRPPAEESHYHVRKSSAFADDVLARLARRDDCAVIFSPRYAYQAERLSTHGWRRAPVILHNPASFAALYSAVDVVLSGGGTMTREAAYSGVPASYDLSRGTRRRRPIPR